MEKYFVYICVEDISTKVMCPIVTMPIVSGSAPFAKGWCDDINGTKELG